MGRWRRGEEEGKGRGREGDEKKRGGARPPNIFGLERPLHLSLSVDCWGHSCRRK